MRVHRGTSLALGVIFLMFQGSVAATPLLANAETVVTDSELNAAMANRADNDAASREAILNLLGRDEIRGVTGRLGVDLTRVKAAVSTLSGEDLQAAAAQAQLADQALAGGDEKIVIGSTVLIIVLLVVIILVAAS
jgi:hypothetical protein